MPERPEDFEEAWARIVADLTSDADRGGGADGGAGPGSSETEPGSPAGPGSPETGPGSPETGPGSPGPGGAAGDVGTGDPGALTGGLAALFEPLRQASREPAPSPEPETSGDPGAFVDNWQDEGHFTPPEPPELPEGTPVKRLAWAGLLGGPTTLALLALTGWPAPRIVGIAAGLATLAGFVTLVWLLPDAREDSGWDDGARL